MLPFFSLIEQNPRTRPWLQNEKEFFVRIARQGSEYPIDVNDEQIEKKSASFEGYEGSPWEGLRLTSGNPFSNVYYVTNFGNVVRNPSRSFKKTGLYEVQGVFSGRRDVATFREDKDTVRYVWKGAGRLKEEEDLFIGGFYGVDGFPVRDSSLKKYLQQYGYNLPDQFDINVIDVSDKNPHDFIIMRQDANRRCDFSSFQDELKELREIADYYNIGRQGVRTVEDDLAHLDNLCMILFSYRVDPPLLVALKPLSSTIVSLTPDTMKTYFSSVSENMSNNSKTLETELNERIQSDMNVKRERLDELYDTFGQNTGVFTKKLNSNLERHFHSAISDTERQKKKATASSLATLDRDVQSVEYELDSLLSNPFYKLLRPLERGLQKIF